MKQAKGELVLANGSKVSIEGYADERLPGHLFLGPAANKPDFMLKELAKELKKRSDDAVANLAELLSQPVESSFRSLVQALGKWFMERVKAANMVVSLLNSNLDEAKKRLDLWNAESNSTPVEYEMVILEAQRAGVSFDAGALSMAKKMFDETTMYFADEASRCYFRKTQRPECFGKKDIIELVREVASSRQLANCLLPGDKHKRRPSIPRAVRYIRENEDEACPFRKRIVQARFAVQTQANKSHGSTNAIWRSIAQEAKPSHKSRSRTKNHPAAGVVEIQQGW